MKLKYRISIGDRFGRLTITGVASKGNGGERIFQCRCDCGKKANVRATSLGNKTTVSCGCWRSEKAAITGKNGARHGLSRRGNVAVEYNLIKNIFQRCSNPNNSEWKNYGGRGISVYPEWKDAAKFLEYLKNSIGLRPSALYSIDRINHNGNYEPGNLRWATAKEQSVNRRKICRIEEFTDYEILVEVKRRQLKC